MDFAAALAKLEQTASSNNQNRREDGDDRWRRRDRDHYDSHGGGRPQQRMRYNSRDHHNSSNPLDELVRFGYRLRPYPQKDEPSPADLRPKHLCLLLLCIDSVPYFDIWNAFANPENDDQANATVVSLVIHAKYPNQLFQDDKLKKHLLLRSPRVGRGNSFADPEPFTLTPNWGSVKLTEAMICLLGQGMRNGLDNDQRDGRFATRRFVLSVGGGAPESVVPPVDHFVFISESCLPVRTLRECSDMIWGRDEVKLDTDVDPVGVAGQAQSETDMASSGKIAPSLDDASTPAPASTLSNSFTLFAKPALPKSWIYARNLNTPGVPRNKYERDQLQNIHRMIPESCRWKADQWLLLSRPHADAVLQVDAHMRPEDQLINSFSKVSASDEVYFPTVLAVLGILKEGDTSTDILMRQVTYVDWSEGMRNPASFERGIRDLRRIAKRAREQGSLFARKFTLRHPGREEVTGRIEAAEWRALMIELGDEECKTPTPDNPAGKVVVGDDTATEKL